MQPNPVRTVTTRLLGSTALVVGVVAALVALPAAVATPVAAQERVEVSVEFRDALTPHGKWQRHSRWGEVWVPANVGRDWRPYTRGRWVYTDDYGWYWTAADEEAAWGLVTYHYGRWIDDGDTGWVWVPGREWGPAWVDWRRGEKAVGWAPLPPDEVAVEMREQPNYWVFVRPRDLVAERVTSVLLPPRERDVYIRETVVVNRTVIVSDRGPRFAVNPGIPPAYIAAAYGRPIRTWSVQPRVLVGTGRIPGAVEIRVDDLRDRRSRVVRDTSYLRQTKTSIQPARDVPAAQALTGDQGRLGDDPPRAARQAAPSDAPAGADARRQGGTAPAGATTGGATTGGKTPGQATGARDGERGPATGERRDQTPPTREGSRPADRDETRRQGAAPAERDDARPQGAERREDRRDDRRERQGSSDRGKPADRTGRGDRPGQERTGQDRPAATERPGSGQSSGGATPGEAQRGSAGRPGGGERPTSAERPGADRPSATTGRGGGDAAPSGRGAGGDRSPGGTAPAGRPSGGGAPSGAGGAGGGASPGGAGPGGARGGAGGPP